MALSVLLTGHGPLFAPYAQEHLAVLGELDATMPGSEARMASPSRIVE